MTGTKFDVDAIIAAGSDVLSFGDGATVYNHGDAGDCAYIVKSGCVEIRLASHSVETLCVGEIFGEVSLIDGGPRAATALADGDLELVPIHRSLFASLLRDDEEFAFAVLRLMARRRRATIELYAESSSERSSAVTPRPAAETAA